MLSRGTGPLAAARAEGRALAAISTYTLESTRAIVAAAEAAGQPVLVQAGSSSFAAAGRAGLAGLALALAGAAAVPVGVHLDHSRDLAEVAACVGLGYSSVMIDGSHLPFEENVALTRSAVELAHPAGVWVEAELGTVPGDEDRSVSSVAGSYTDPDRAAELVARTGVDALAVAVGNVHGIAEPAPVLDLDRLAAIAAVVEVPLVLHGASGLPDDALRAAVALGVAKVNINTELRRAYVMALAGALPAAGDDVVALQRAAIAAMTAVARDKIELLGRPSSGSPAREGA